MVATRIGALFGRDLTSLSGPIIFAVANPIITGSVVVTEVGTRLELARHTAPALFARAGERGTVTLPVTFIGVAFVNTHLHSFVLFLFCLPFAAAIVGFCVYCVTLRLPCLASSVYICVFFFLSPFFLTRCSQFFPTRPGSQILEEQELDLPSLSGP